MPDVTGQGVYTWNADKMPIKVWISEGKNVPGYRPVFGQYIRTSFDWWCNASGNKLSWVEVNDPNKADITVQWTDQVTERPEGTEAGKTSCLTRLNTQTGQGVIYGARMQMLTRLPGREFGDAEVSKTCLHEAGHAFGLQGHSHDRNDIMYYAVGPAQEFALSERDKTTMARLYQSYPVTGGLALGAKAPALTAPVLANPSHK
jgi:predicted Zn-dependent protease